MTKLKFGAVILVVVTALLQCQISFATTSTEDSKTDCSSYYREC